MERLKRGLKAKKCRICRCIYMPVRSMQKVCSPACAEELGRQEKARDEARAKRVASAEYRAALELMKTRGDHLRELQTAFNQWIRLRDAALPCISCGRPATWKGQWDAGHYRSRGSSPALRFDPDNVHKQCGPCNVHLSGNLIAYRVGLVTRRGLEVAERLEGPHEPLKLTVPEIMEMKKQYRAKIRQLKAQQAEVNQTLEETT